jgi:DNA-binding CsgD family transcriptional regulator
MIRYLTFLFFILSVAIASGGILLSARLRNRHKTEFLSVLFYYQVFIFTFGFYGIWGQSVINIFLPTQIDPEILRKISEIALLLGLPFIIFAWLMLLKLSAGISGRIFSSRMVVYFLFINFSFVFLAGYFLAGKEEILTVSLIKYYFISMSLVYTAAFAFMLLVPGKGELLIGNYDRRIIATGTIIVMLIQVSLLVFYTSQIYLALAYILTFFAGNSFIPLYLSYGTVLPGLKKEAVAEDLSLDDFCRKYDVSPREKDIIREICKGLSNKEISDKLFISLQTVKDHTHRIYIKTNLKSRVQLINLVKEATNQRNGTIP